MSQTQTDYDRVGAALAAMQARHPRKIDLGLERIERVLEKLDNPQNKLPPAVHVAGTNGKGSTIALLRAMAEAAGLSCHIYTSPHLVRFNERIVLGSVEVDDGQLADALERIMAAAGDDALTFFEATTAAAFLLFSEHQADLAIIEVGLGGRFDATNVLTPALSLITPIDFDHAEFLGRDLSKIAQEKAGIIKSHMPVLSAPQADIARAVLRAEAGKQRAPLQSFNEHFRAWTERGRLTYEDETALLDLPLPALKGAHQIMNAGLAIAAARHLHISDKAIGEGLQCAVWPARMQPLTDGPLVDMASAAGAELWLDGGHNPHAAHVLSGFMADLEARDPRPLVLIMGILANKDAGGFLDYFEGLAGGLIAVNIPGHIGLAPETLAELAAYRNIPAQIADNLTDALQRAINTGEALSRQTPDELIKPPRVLICGSLYLAGQVLRMT